MMVWKLSFLCVNTLQSYVQRQILHNWINKIGCIQIQNFTHFYNCGSNKRSKPSFWFLSFPFLCAPMCNLHCSWHWRQICSSAGEPTAKALGDSWDLSQNKNPCIHKELMVQSKPQRVLRFTKAFPFSCHWRVTSGTLWHLSITSTGHSYTGMYYNIKVYNSGFYKGPKP